MTNPLTLSYYSVIINISKRHCVNNWSRGEREMFSDMFKSIRSGREVFYHGNYFDNSCDSIFSSLFVSTDQDVHAAAQTFKAKAKIAGSDLSEVNQNMDG